MWSILRFRRITPYGKECIRVHFTALFSESDGTPDLAPRGMSRLLIPLAYSLAQAVHSLCFSTAAQSKLVLQMTQPGGQAEC